MLNRINQVISALTAKITRQDECFVAEQLNVREQKLFWQMNLPDQRHALNVTHTALKLAQTKAGINLTLLTKVSLLHDVGKVRGDVSTFDKIATVIAHKLFPGWAESWGKLGRGSKVANLRHAFYIYFHHASRSAVMLQQIGANPLVTEIVSKHHQAPAESDPPELVILRAADDMN